MNTMKNKRIMSFIMAIVMMVTMIPAMVFSIGAQEKYPVMMQFTAASSGDFHKYYNKVYSVTFLDEIDTAAMNGALESWDISASAETGTVMAWMYLNDEATAAAGDNRYDVYIAGDGGVGANPDSGCIFYCFYALKEVNNAENFKTHNATSFKLMFSKCYELEYVDLSGWDTGNVVTLEKMFDMTLPKGSTIIPALRTVDFSGWNTSNVTNMSYMFRDCYELEVLDLSSFDTSKVTTMQYMFYKCKKLEYIYAGDGWTTQAIANLNEGVFNCCYAKLGVTEEEYEKLTYAPDVSASLATFEEDGGFLTYKAPEAPKEYKVTYEFTGEVPEGITAPGEVIYNEGTEVVVEAAPSAEGYEFSGWSTDDADITNGTFVIENDVHIVGSWTKIKTYKVEYKYDSNYLVPEGAPDLPETVYYKAGEWVDVNGVYYIDGYIFIGWYTDDADVAGDMFIMPENDVTLYAYFKKPVESVEIINNGDVIINSGDKAKINVYVKPEDATIKDIIYESSDESVATVDKYGNVKAVGEGTATIIVYSKDDPTKSDTIEVTVKIPVTSLTVETKEFELTPGDKEEIIATVTPENATNKELTYLSSNEGVVKVDENGKIEAIGDGEATITITSKDNTDVKEIITVTVKTPVKEITATEDFTINLYEEKNVDASVNEDATNKELIYESGDPGIVKVDIFGNVTGVGEGTTTVTIISKDNPSIKETVTVTVKIPVEDIVTDKEEITLDVGDKEKLEVNVTPNNATNKELVFESSDEKVVKVDENGNITAVGEGEATITITSKDDETVKETVKIIVEVPVKDIVTEKEEITLDVGDKEKLEVNVTPNNATNKELVFESSDEKVVKVDENGNITAVGEGTATITVTSKYDTSIKETITVAVTKPEVPVKDVVVDKTKVDLEIGETDKITVTVTPNDATNKEVTYKSSNEDVVKVDENGNIIAVGEGTATITVTSKYDNSIKEIITVIVKAEPTTEPTTEEESTTEPTTEPTTEEESTTEPTTEPTTEEESTTEPTTEPTTEEESTTEPTTEPTTEEESTTEPTTKPEKPGYTVTLPEGINLFKGETTKIKVEITPDDTGIEPIFRSSDESIVKVDFRGNVTAVGIGLTTITVDLGGGDIRIIPVAVVAAPTKHHICFGKTDGIGWYEVSVNGGDTFLQGPNSTLEVYEGSVVTVRLQDMWIDDEFDFYVNGKKVEDVANTIVVVVDGYMLIGALSMDVEVPDVEESVSLFQKLLNAIKNFFAWIASWFK